MGVTHRYRTDLSWTGTAGTTGAGYRGYDRTHRVTATPAADGLTISADAHFGGDPDRLNPEQLLLAAASSCQLLSFLALAARAGVDVVRYADVAEAEMPVTRGPMRITTITLRPVIVVADGSDIDAVQALVQEAHTECFIANSLAVEMVIEASVEHAGARPAAP